MELGDDPAFIRVVEHCPALHSHEDMDKLYRRVELVRNRARSADEQRELADLDKFAESLPTRSALHRKADKFVNLMMDYAKDMPHG